MHVMDVAQALNALHAMGPLPQTLNLPGPTTHTYAYLLDLVSTLTYNPPSRAPVVPKQAALLLARAAQSVWWPALSPDEVERRFINDVEVPGDWDKVGVAPTEIEENAIMYLRRYRSAYVSPSARRVLTRSHISTSCVSLSVRTTFVPSSCPLLASTR